MKRSKALKVSGHLRKSPLGNIGRFVKKVHQRQSLLWVFKLLKRMRISFPSVKNPESLSWAITRTEFGVKAIALSLFFAKTVFVSWLASLSKIVVLLVKGIVKAPSARVHLWTIKSLLYTHHLAIPKLTHKNIGFCSVLFMASDAVLDTGMTKLTPFSFLLD
jgi:hypothetical protein